MQRQYRCADYTVGWVCALPVELAAAQLMLDERHPELEHGETNDDNLYVLGRINGHNVAIGCLPAGRTGTVSVAVVATQMLAAFPKIRFGLMVGIGGGVPSAEADIRLGDVVVSQPDGTFGGVVQYDLGKTTIHGFLRTGSLNSPPDVLLNAVARIQANEYLEKSTLQHHASRLEAERSKFQRSRGGRDILFDASYDHQDPHDRMCTMCDPNKVYIRESRLPGEEVVVHYGTIGSGNKVMKSALERDRVSAQLGGVLCFEMEAAGLMSTFPCLVIRGICDYSDSHKNDRWQPYAAGNAAAYAKEVLSVLKPIEVARTQIAMNDIDGESALQVTHSSRHQQNDRDATTMNNTTSAGVTVTIHGTASRSSSQADQSLYQSQNRSPSPLSIPAKHTLSEEQRKTIKNSLHFKQRDARLLTLKQAQTKTCQWLLKNPKYVDWIHADKLHQHRGFFWIKGKPGSGKSIMMKYLFSCAKRSMHGSIVLSFFFNARGAILEKTTSGLYRALILQLLDKAPQTWTAFEDDDDLDALLNLVEQSGWQDELLRQLFVRCLRKLENERVVCYVDALDECPEAAIRDMISLFEEIGEMKSTAEFRVCFSSRHYPEISIRTGLQLVLELEAEHIDDITLYIDANLRMGNDPQLKEVRAELLRKASGIFLWVHLVIPELNKEYDRGRIKALKKRLAQTPIGLHELFVDILTRDQRKLGHFRRCVEIILHAIRPLNPSELNAALEAYKDVSGFRVDDDSILMDPDGLRKYVLDSSKGLAEITKSVLPTVQWIHESVRDFFLKEGGMSKLKSLESSSQDLMSNLSGHSIFVSLCLRQFRYAMTTDISGFSLASYEHHKLFQWYPFLNYALSAIFKHANEAHKANQDQASFHEQFKVCENFWRTYADKLKRPIYKRFEKYVHILYHLSEDGADELIRLHPDKNTHLALKGGVYGLPLLAALYANQTDAARALLDLPSRSGSAEIDIRPQPTFGLSQHNYETSRHLLTYLCEFGDLDLLQSALLTKQDTVAMQSLYEHAASEAIVDMLAVVSYSICENGRSPHHGGTPVEFPRNDSNSNLYANLQHLRHLLERYPDVRYDSAVWPMEDLLSYAASRGFHRITKLYIGSSGIRCREKAFIAATRGKNNQKGRIEVVKQLLDAGLELHHDRDAVKDAMFDMILEPHNEDLVRVLLTRVEWYLEARNRNSLTPLLWALHRGRKTYFKIFLDAGANLMEPNALESAIHMGDLDSLRLLLKNPNCRVDARDEFGRTALFWCVSPLGFEDGVLSELLAEPALLPNSTDIRGETALMHAVLLWDEKAVRIMLESGVVSPDGGSSSTQTALGLSLTTYVRTKEDVYLRIARKLLLCGADLYCNRVLPTPADIIAEYDENLYAELRDLCQFSKRQGVHEE